MYFSLWEVKCKIVWNAPWSAIQIVLKCIIIFSWIHFREKKSKRKQEIICTIETDKSINILKYITLSRKTKWWANQTTSLIILISNRVTNIYNIFYFVSIVIRKKLKGSLPPFSDYNMILNKNDSFDYI